MNGRKLFREYAQSKGYDAQEFIEIQQEFYSDDTFVFRDSNRNQKSMTLDYRDMIHWIIKTKK